VVGAGVARLTAAAPWSTAWAPGQIATAERIENFPGFPQGIGGHALGPLLHEQAEAAGAEFLLDTIEGLEIAGDARILRGAAESLRAPAVIIAAGSALRPLGIPGEAEFLGRGVSHCASCDGPLFAGREAWLSAVAMRRWTRRGSAVGAAPVAVFHRGTSLRAQHALLVTGQKPM
jgi:thioredoxin reductase (NADPH)